MHGCLRSTALGLVRISPQAPETVDSAVLLAHPPPSSASSTLQTRSPHCARGENQRQLRLARHRLLGAGCSETAPVQVCAGHICAGSARWVKEKPLDPARWRRQGAVLLRADFRSFARGNRGASLPRPAFYRLPAEVTAAEFAPPHSTTRSAPARARGHFLREVLSDGLTLLRGALTARVLAHLHIRKRARCDCRQKKKERRKS